jgi:hypothetical protein
MPVAPMVMASHIGTGILLIVGNVIAGGCGERVGKVGEERLLVVAFNASMYVKNNSYLLLSVYLKIGEHNATGNFGRLSLQKQRS